MFQSNYSLVLYPNDFLFSLPEEQLINILSGFDFIGSQEAEDRYLIGEQFLSFICFMGCSPDIELTPQPDNKPYSYIELTVERHAVQCMISQNVKLPRCPHCKADLLELPTLLKKQCSLAVNCHSCNEVLNPAKLNWRKTAAFAKNIIAIGNIYEAEAVPDQQLLDLLEEATGVAWKYAYIRT